MIIGALGCGIAIANCGKEQKTKNLIPFVSWIAFGCITSSVSRCLLKYYPDGKITDVMGTIQILWVLLLIIILVVTTVVRYRNGQIAPEKMSAFLRQLKWIFVFTICVALLLGVLILLVRIRNG